MQLCHMSIRSSLKNEENDGGKIGVFLLSHFVGFTSQKIYGEVFKLKKLQ